MGRGKGKRSNSRKESNEPPAKRRSQVDVATTVTRETRRGARAVRNQGRSRDPPMDQMEPRQEDNSDEPLKRQDIPTLVHEVIRRLSSQTADVVPSPSTARQEEVETAPTAVTTTATTAAVQDPSGSSSQTFTTPTEPAASSSALSGATQLQPGM